MSSAALTGSLIWTCSVQAIPVSSQSEILLGRSPEQSLTSRHELITVLAGSLHRRSSLNKSISPSWPDRLTRRAGGPSRRRSPGAAGDTPHASRAAGQPSEPSASGSGQPHELRDPSTYMHDRPTGRVPASLKNAPTLAGMRQLAASFPSSRPLTMRQVTGSAPSRSSQKRSKQVPVLERPSLNMPDRPIRTKAPEWLKTAPALPGMRQLGASLPSSLQLTMKQAVEPIPDQKLHKQQASSSSPGQLKRKPWNQAIHEAESSSSSKRRPVAVHPTTQTRPWLLGDASAGVLRMPGSSSSHPPRPSQPSMQSHHAQETAGDNTGSRNAKTPPQSPASAPEEWLSWLNNHGGSPSHT